VQNGREVIKSVFLLTIWQCKKKCVLLQRVVAKKVGAKNILWKLPSKRQSASAEEGFRILKGHCPNTVSFREGEMTLTVEPKSGQKSGAFLDLRGLRKYVSLQKLNGARVLNLFSYTGTLGLAAEKAGANEIWNLDISQGALDAAKKYHTTKPEKHRFMAEDIFEWFQSLPTKEKFDLIIIDPPQMASRMSQVPQALRVYSKLYTKAKEHLKPKGKVIGACCSSRILRKDFEKELKKAMVPPLRFKTSLLNEEDHPVTFTEGDYLKILIFENK
jgi:23S rRNA (cytosine1962-C5)-methyltransferase